jgi:hypothetical protein
LGAGLVRLKEVTARSISPKAFFRAFIADWSDDNVSIVKKIVQKSDLASLRDVALHYDAPKLAALVDRNEIPADAQVPIADGNLRLGVATFLENQSDFNIRTTSIYTALKLRGAFKDISEDYRSGIIENLKVLQHVQAISSREAFWRRCPMSHSTPG